jgi:hypothetical protein
MTLRVDFLCLHTSGSTLATATVNSARPPASA